MLSISILPKYPYILENVCFVHIMPLVFLMRALFDAFFPFLRIQFGCLYFRLLCTDILWNTQGVGFWSFLFSNRLHIWCNMCVLFVTVPLCRLSLGQPSNFWYALQNQVASALHVFFVFSVFGAVRIILS